MAQTTPPDVLRTLLGDGAPEVARIFPELRQLFTDLAAPLDLPPEQSRAYLFRCLREFLERVSEQRPLIVVLEDLHWADEGTLLLLEHLVPHLNALSMLMVATYRDTDLEVSRPLEKSLRNLVRERLLTKIAVRRLGLAAVADLLEDLSGRKVPETLARLIHSETEGNPFFVEEVYLHLAEEGRLLDESGQWRDDLSLEEAGRPGGSAPGGWAGASNSSMRRRCPA